MLRVNLWTSKGLVNGSIGEVVDILYKRGEKSPDDIPVVVLRKFKSCIGPGIGISGDVVPVPVSSVAYPGRVVPNPVQEFNFHFLFPMPAQSTSLKV